MFGDRPERADRQVGGDVAIIGMAGLFPGAPDVTRYWQNILTKVDAITDPPPGAWDPAVHYDPMSSENDRAYCRRGGYLASVALFEPLEHGVMPRAIDGGEPDQWLALKVARAALSDAGYIDRLDTRERTAVVIGKGTYVNRGNFGMVEHAVVVDQILAILRSLHPNLAAADLELVRRELKASLPPFNSETAMGLIPNIAAGRIANRLDLMGPSYTVDAACASSLIAAQIASRDLLTGECDLALVGGAHVTTSVPIFALFCQLNALSHRQQIRPFDRHADGTILGEGIGMVVLKRRIDAERDGDRIYALLKSVGTSSDGRGVSLMAPRRDGEELALRRAYDAAGIDPSTVELLEAHGTGTPIGDQTELEALGRVYGPRRRVVPRTAIGTVKSMIGHTMPAAGIAGLIKTALALYHRVLPPTLNADEPIPTLVSETTPFYVNTETRPWIHGDPRVPRRAGVNAFGFGGINAHAILEEASTADEERLMTHDLEWETEIVILQAATRPALVERVGQLIAFLDGEPDVTLKDLAYTLNTERQPGDARLGVVASSLDDLRVKLLKARDRLADSKHKQIKDVNGIYYFAQPLAREGKIAVLFPGEGAQYTNMLADLCARFPGVRAAFDQMDRAFVDHPRGFTASDFIFPAPHLAEADRTFLEQTLWQSDGAWEAILTANASMWSLVTDLGVRPDVIVGHSTGEYSAMRAAGILDLSTDPELFRFVQHLNRGYQLAVADQSVPKAVLLAVGADRATVEEMARQAGGSLYVAMDNCPHQAVIVGEREAVDRALELVKRDGLIYEYLVFDRAYHTPLYAPYLEHLRAAYADAKVGPARLPIYSCTSASPYPADPAEIRHLMLDHWVAPVEFRRTIERLYDEGIRVFFEVGPRGNLSAFVEDILRGRPHAAVPINVLRRTGVTQLHHALAILTAHGVSLDLGVLYRRRQPRVIEWKSSGSVKTTRPLTIQLATDYPSFRLSDAVATDLRRKLADSERLLADLQSGEDQRRDAAPVTVARENLSPGPDVEVLRRSIGEARPPESTNGSALQARGSKTNGDDSPPNRIASENEPVVKTLSPRVPEPRPKEDERAPVLAASIDAAEPLGNGDENVAEGRDTNGHVAELAGALWSVDSVGADEYSLANEADDPGIVPSGADDAMLSYLETMDRFLTAQRSVMEAYLGDPATRDRSPDERGPDRRKVQGRPEAEAATPASASGLPRTFQGQDGESGYPLLGEILDYTPDEELIAERTFDPSEDLYLRDHTLGRDVSRTDPSLIAMALVPMTMTLEVLAEAAQALSPERLVIGLQHVRAHRWIAFDDGPQTLRVVARRDGENPDLVHVSVRNLTEDGAADDPLKSPVAEAIAVVADCYPPSTLGPVARLRNPRRSRWSPERLYREAMFHGPIWQAVEAIEHTAEDGAVALMRVLPFEAMLRDNPAPRFVFDPIILDAAGQVPGFWTQEHLREGNVLFPFRVDALEVFGPLRPSGELTTAVASIKESSDLQIRWDIDVYDRDGLLWMRLLGWADKRFYLPPGFYQTLLSLDDAEVSTDWPEVVGLLGGYDRGAAEARMPIIARKVVGRFPSDRAFWKRVWASAILSRTERALFAGLRTSERRQLAWLAGRAAAKEAVQRLLREVYGLQLPPADIEILPDERGRPVVGGNWTDAVARRPVVSIAHCDDSAAAVASLPDPSDDGRAPLLGLDLETRRTLAEGFVDVAFGEGERRIFVERSDAEQTEWMLRAWCAKEAAAKAVGMGLVDGPSSIEVASIDWATGTLKVQLRGSLARAYPTLAERSVIVYTMRADEHIVAATLCEPAGDH